MNSATQAFIREHATDDVRQLALGRVPADVNLHEALTQIEGRQLAARKLPLLAATDGILFPPRLSLEQCSSEATARYKRHLLYDLSSLNSAGGPTVTNDEVRMTNKSNLAGSSDSKSDSSFVIRHSSSRIPDSSLVIRHSSFLTLTSYEANAPTFIDLTGGFGIDFMAIAPLFSRAVYVERNAALCDLARHNLPLMGCAHAEVVCGEAEAILSGEPAPATTVLLIDPARRDAAGRKVALIEDCTPDICALQERLRAHAACTLIKLSPMLDIKAALRALRGVTDVHVVSVDGECKELLLVMQPAEEGDAACCIDNVPIHCVDLAASPHPADTPNDAPSAATPLVKSSFTFTLAEEHSISQDYLLPSLIREGVGESLFEPNASILKAGAFKSICRRYPVQKLAQHSHLYAAHHDIPDFPGRRWHVLDSATFNKHDLKRLLAGVDAADITARGFPLSVAALRKQLHLREGGTTHLIATTLADNTRVLLKVQSA